jgi:uncharacterized membrane protein YbhN (UPF0104 family)
MNTRRRRPWRAARLVGAALILGLLVQRVGTGPFLAGLRGLGAGTLLTATAIGAGTTLCSAWRWRVVAGALGMSLSRQTAVAAYYRSQFLNSALPGGVLGDVHRGVLHGIDAGDLGRGVRAVVWERVAGQVVQACLTLGVLLTVASPVRTAMPLLAVAAALAGIVLLVTGRRLLRHGRGRLAGVLRLAVVEGRDALLQPGTWPAVLLASLLVLAGHLAMFLLAARAAGLSGSVHLVLPLALVVLLAAAIPLNVGGWGPREGMAAWVFAAAGWGAGTGAAVATAFGVMTCVATLPGAVVLLLEWLRRDRSGTAHGIPPVTAGVLHGGAREDGMAHG